MRTVVLIPARGGSKAIPRKNLVDLGGRPLLAWVISTAQTVQQAGIVDHVVVSTEDQEIAEVARELGADLPFVRPGGLAEDEISIISVLQNAQENFKMYGWHTEAVLSLQPTSPFIKAGSLIDAINLMKLTNCDSVVSVSRIHHAHPYRAYNLNENKALSPLFEQGERYLQKQDLPPFYTFSGGFYLRKSELLPSWNNADFCLGDDIRGIELDSKESLDIDTIEDLEFCRHVIS